MSQRAPFILVVDDEAILCALMAEFLGNKGLRVETATRGEEALKKAAVDPPTLVFLDLKMPGMSWEDTLRGLKEINPRVQVVIISACYQEGLPGDYRHLRYLAKPVKLEEIEETVEAAGIHPAGEGLSF